jgi:hypothetical protein
MERRNTTAAGLRLIQLIFMFNPARLSRFSAKMARVSQPWSESPRDVLFLMRGRFGFVAQT